MFVLSKIYKNYGFCYSVGFIFLGINMAMPIGKEFNSYNASLFFLSGLIIGLLSYFIIK